MSRLQLGDKVWVSEDPYEEWSQTGYATVTKVTDDGLIEVQFDPMLVSRSRIHPRPARGGR